jgi:hypothetical protein
MRLISRPFCLAAVVSLLPLIAAAGDAATPLIDKVRNATARYIDINKAKLDKFVVGTPCVSGPDAGAMGVHLVRPDRIMTLVLDATQPQALIYEPMADGAMRLVGVEYILLAQNWPDAGSPPALDGNLFNYIDAPNRFGLPAFYEIHVWAWEDNPKGSYADWNTHVTCAHQPL